MPYADRLHEVADILENVPFVPKDTVPEQHGFNMRNAYYDCGSPSCIAGWIRYLYAREEHSAERTGDLIGLESLNALQQLFAPETETAHYRANPGDPGFITPERAANTLRHLAETGEVNWDAPKVDLYGKKSKPDIAIFGWSDTENQPRKMEREYA